MSIFCIIWYYILNCKKGFMAKTRRKEDKEYKKSKRLFLGLLCCLAAFFILYALISASNTGIIGEALSAVMFSCFGAAAYVIPVILFWFGIIYFITSSVLRTRIDSALAAISVTLTSVLFSLIKLKHPANAECLSLF